jgi:hypothetical protein
MPWLASDREKIRKFLGFRVTVNDIATIQASMDDVATVSAPAIDTAQYHLKELTKIQDALDSDRPYAATASYSNAGSSTDYYPGQKLGVSRSEGQRHVRELSQLLNLVIRRDVFSVEVRSAKLRRS